MSQYDGITEATSPWSGATAQANLLSLVAHLMSQGAGSTRPSNLEAGGLWSDDLGSGDYVLKLFDGTSDLAIPTQARTALRFDVGGTADALTLTSGLDLASFPTGYRGYFIPTAANTGATTFAIDAGSATTVKTVTGEDLPAGYLRNGVLTEFWNDGSNLIVNRLPEYGSNANGDYVRLADGRALCWGTTGPRTVQTASGNLYRSNTIVTWDLPITMANTDSMFGGLTCDSEFRWGAFSVVDTDTVEGHIFGPTSNASGLATRGWCGGLWY